MNQGDFSLDELMLLARHFNTTISGMVRETSSHEDIDPAAEDALVVIGGLKMPCRVVTRPVNHLAATGLFAFETAGGGLTVCTVADSPPQVPLRTVVSLQINEQNFPRMRVAVVDDEAPATLVRYLNDAGFDAAHYCEAEPVIELLNSGRRPDAYVLDGTLAKGRTSRRLMEAIRNIDTTVPILLLTGAIESDPNNETDIVQMMANFSVEVLLRLAPPALIANKLRSMLNLEQAP